MSCDGDIFLVSSSQMSASTVLTFLGAVFVTLTAGLFISLEYESFAFFLRMKVSLFKILYLYTFTEHSCSRHAGAQHSTLQYANHPKMDRLVANSPGAAKPSENGYEIATSMGLFLLVGP